MRKILASVLLCSMIFGITSSGAPNARAEVVASVSGPGLGVTVTPSNVGASSLTSVSKDKSLKKVTLGWTVASNASGYLIMRKEGKKEFAQIATVSLGTATSYVDNTVKAGKSYSYAIVPYCLVGTTVQRGAMSGAKSVSLIPGKIKGLKLRKSGRKFILTWKKTSNVSGYQVYTKVFVKGIKLKYSHAKTMKKRVYRRGMLVHGMKYGFMVRSYKKVGKKKIYGPFREIKKRA